MPALAPAKETISVDVVNATNEAQEGVLTATVKEAGIKVEKKVSVKPGETLTVTFDQAKTNIEEIGKKVAASGHDTEKVKATDTVYDKLPGCCKYR